MVLPRFPVRSTDSQQSLTTKDVSVSESFDYAVAYLFNGGGTHEMKGGYQVFTVFNDVQLGNNAIGQFAFQLWPVDLDDYWGRSGYSRQHRVGSFSAARERMEAGKISTRLYSFRISISPIGD